ncbi:MAG: dicarboxylate/amino acid:cation symporter [Bacillaceae bacterium]
MKLTRNILIALILGLIVGLTFNLFMPEIFPTINEYLFVPLGNLFVKLIKMLVVPIVFFSIALGAAGIGDPKKLGRIGGKSLLFFLTTTGIGITIAMIVALIFKPGNVGSFDLANATYEGTTEAPSFIDTLLNIIPENPIAAASEGNMLQIIFFAAFLGLGMSLISTKVQTLYKVMEEINELMMKLVSLVMYTAPIGAFALICSSIGQLGLQGMQAMLLYLAVVLLCLFIHAIVTYGTALKLLGNMSPIHFIKNFFPAIAVAFSTSSSSATLPVAMKTVQEKLYVSKSISSFIQPLGATINMDGTAIMQGVATIFIAQVFQVELTFTQMLLVVLTAILASVGTAGVPGVGLIMLAMVLEQVNLPVEGIALIIGVERIIDMFRTSVNITGDAVCAIIVARSEEKHEPVIQQMSA